MPSLGAVFPELFAALANHYGRAASPRLAGAPFEAIVRAVLTRSTDAKKADRILERLRDEGLLTPAALASADRAELSEVLRQARVAPPSRWLGSLSQLAAWFADREDSIEETPTEVLRDELIALRGIGAATADAVLLLGLNRAVYPVDRATYRILVRHGWIDPIAEYDEARDTIERQAGGDPARLVSLSDWLGSIGADFCRVSAPRCERCPLRPFLPEEGPIEPDADLG
jgi:endonuclease-3 related protein